MDNYVTGAAIKGLREAKGLTQEELAARIHVSAKAVSKWKPKRLPGATPSSCGSWARYLLRWARR